MNYFNIYFIKKIIKFLKIVQNKNINSNTQYILIIIISIQMKRNKKNNSIIHYKKIQKGTENYLLYNYTKSFNPEEEMSNLFKNINIKKFRHSQIFKSKYPY